MELFSTITYTSAIFSDLSLVLRHLIKSIVYVSLIWGASDFHFHKLISKSTSLWFGIHVLKVKSYYISIYQKLYSVLLFQWTRMFELQRALKLHQGGIARYCSNIRFIGCYLYLISWLFSEGHLCQIRKNGLREMNRPF